MRHSVFLPFVATALAAISPTLSAQGPETAPRTWRLEGLHTAFCVQFLMDPASEALKELPPGYHAVPASEVADLHVALRGVVEGQPEFGAWSPSRLCFDTADTVQTDEYTLSDHGGRHPQLFASWTVLAAAPGGSAGDVALRLFTSSDRRCRRLVTETEPIVFVVDDDASVRRSTERLIRSARLAGHVVREARLAVGLVPTEDENGVPSSDKRFQMRAGKTTITWDGPPVRESAAVREPWRMSWTATGTRGDVVSGEVMLSPVSSRPMVGSLKVEGKDAFAKALRASPTRFAGPAYQGGGGSISLRQ